MDPLIRNLHDPDWYVRYAAADALGKIGDVRAAGPLAQATRDKDECVRNAASAAMKRNSWTG